MRTIGFFVSSMLGMAVLASGAAAQERFESPWECVADVAWLDANGDGYVDNYEYSDFRKVRTNVDANGDGWISNAEKTVACREGVMSALKPADRR